jgi:hypothetical protein
VQNVALALSGDERRLLSADRPTPAAGVGPRVEIEISGL